MDAVEDTSLIIRRNGGISVVVAVVAVVAVARFIFFSTRRCDLVGLN
jgi:hypothetical protein